MFSNLLKEQQKNCRHAIFLLLSYLTMINRVKEHIRNQGMQSNLYSNGRTIQLQYFQILIFLEDWKLPKYLKKWKK